MMFISIMGVIFGLGLFIVPLWSYRRGLQDGLAIREGKPVEPLNLPKLPVTKKEETLPDPVAEGIANIFSYDGTPQEIQPKE